MILLTSTSDIIQVVTGSALTIDVHASWVDLNGTTVTPGRTNTAISTAATTTVVAAPGASTQRTLKTLSVRNKDASSNLVTVQHYDGSITVQLIGVTLAAGYSLEYDEGDGWVTLDSSGNRITTTLVSGVYLGTTILSSASANFTTSPRTNTIRIRGYGGGGAGGGCSSVGGTVAAAAGGGGSGSYAEKTFSVSPSTAYAYTCGAGGTGVSGGAGNDGGSSTFTVGATTVTCNGGIGGPLAVPATTLTVNLGGAGGASSTNGDINTAGTSGEEGIILIVATPIGHGGDGGSIMGGGGLGSSTSSTGGAATLWGAGGGGSLTTASVARIGGAGSAGCWIVDEFS